MVVDGFEWELRSWGSISLQPSSPADLKGFCIEQELEGLTYHGWIDKQSNWPFSPQLGSYSPSDQWMRNLEVFLSGLWVTPPQFVEIYHLLEGLLESNQETSYHFISGHPARGLIFSVNLVITQEISSAPQARSHLWGWHHLHGLLWPPRPSPFPQL